MAKIIYRQDNGVVAIITPALNELNSDTGKNYTIDEIALKDVPTGYKYKIIDDSDVSSDRSFRDAWTVDEADLTDGEGS